MQRLMMNDIPQAFFQRALACKDVWTAKVSCLVGGLFALLLGIPPMIIGVAGSAASKHLEISLNTLSNKSYDVQNIIEQAQRRAVADRSRHERYRDI